MVLPQIDDVGVIRPETDEVGVIRPETDDVGVMRPENDTGVLLPDVCVRRCRGVVA